MKAEFEEKTYEMLMNIELTRGRQFILAPGQVAEGVLSFDAAFLFSPNHRLARLLNVAPLNPLGVELRHIYGDWSKFEGLINRIYGGIRANTFIQYKRPVYTTSYNPRNRLRWERWKKPHYHFRVNDDQRDRLQRVEEKAGGGSLVTYAAPAIHELEVLLEASYKSQMVNRSVFCRPSAVGDHGTVTYEMAGTQITGFSEPGVIEPLDFMGTVAEMKSHNEVLPFKDFLGKTATQLRDGLKADHKKVLDEILRESQYDLDDTRDMKARTASRDVKIIVGSCSLLNLKWMLVPAKPS